MNQRLTIDEIEALRRTLETWGWSRKLSRPTLSFLDLARDALKDAQIVIAEEENRDRQG